MSYFRISFLLLLFVSVNIFTTHAQIFPKGEWTQKEASELGVEFQFFQEMEEHIDRGEFGEIHSVVVVKDGYLAYENYFNGWHRDSLQSLQSVTKSMVATYLGAAFQQDVIKSVNIPVLSVFENEMEIKNSSAYKKDVTVKDLLTMRSGFEWETGWNNPDNTWRNILDYRGNWYQKIMSRPVTIEPGASFQYHNGNPTLVTGLIQQLSGQSIQEFADKYLFSPLSITHYRMWDGNGGPQNNGATLIFLRPVDLAKIGYLYLNNGTWKSKQVLPGWYVEKATSSQVKGVEENPFYAYDYGYFWWVNPVSKDESFAETAGNVYLARGAGGQSLIAWPEQNLICVITAWNLERPNITQTIFDRFVVPAVNESL